MKRLITVTMLRIILFIVLLPSICSSQFMFEYTGKDTLINIEQNIILVRKLESMINAINSYDNETVVNMPIAFQVRKNKKYFQEGNHVSEYSYNLSNDKVSYGDNDVIVVTIDFDKKKISKKYEKGNEKDHYKPKDKDKKIKEKEKKKIKPTVVGKKIIVR